MLPVICRFHGHRGIRDDSFITIFLYQTFFVYESLHLHLSPDIALYSYPKACTEASTSVHVHDPRVP
jgi:hypothetical protein